MTSLPIPFLVALLLVLQAVANHREMSRTPTGRVFALVLYLYALSSVFIGLRWSQDQVALLPIAATLAGLSSALLYLAFRSLGRSEPVLLLSRDWLHLVPAVAIALSIAANPSWIEVLLISTKLVYSWLLILLARARPDSLQRVRLSWLANTQQALHGAAVLLLSSVVIDIAIAVDFAFYDGRHAENLVGIVNLVVLVLLGWTIARAGRGMAPGGEVDSDAAEGGSCQPEDSNQTRANDSALVERLNILLVDDQLYADADLDLQRLARKAGVPTRAISRAVNATTGMNISQWINGIRIDAACALLENSEANVSQVMMDAGFMTKSNFNREFKRIMGCSPSEWRKEKSANS